MTTVLHIGYGKKGAQDLLDTLLAEHPNYTLFDIRITTGSPKYPTWSRETLKFRYGGQYVWVKSLGNRNRFIKDAPMELADEASGIRFLLYHMHRGIVPILLCGCSNYTKCHRQLVVEALQKKIPDLEVQEVS